MYDQRSKDIRLNGQKVEWAIGRKWTKGRFKNNTKKTFDGSLKNIPSIKKNIERTS